MQRNNFYDQVSSILFLFCPFLWGFPHKKDMCRMTKTTSRFFFNCRHSVLNKRRNLVIIKSWWIYSQAIYLFPNIFSSGSFFLLCKTVSNRVQCSLQPIYCWDVHACMLKFECFLYEKQWRVVIQPMQCKKRESIVIPHTQLRCLSMSNTP